MAVICAQPPPRQLLPHLCKRLLHDSMEAMSLATYQIAHLVGIYFLFAGYGAYASGNRKGMMYHGIGLLILLVSGFGQIAKLKAAMPGLSYTETWLLAKYGIFLLLGFLPSLARRVPGPIVLLLAITLGGFAAYLGFLKRLPF